MSTVNMRKVEVEALDALLDYVIHDEMKNYDGDPKHIYRSIYTLGAMLTEARERGCTGIRDWGDFLSPAAIDRIRHTYAGM